MIDALRKAWAAFAGWVAGLFRPDFDGAIDLLTQNGYVVFRSEDYLAKRGGEPVKPATGLSILDRRIAESADFFERNWGEFATELKDESVANDWKRAVEQADWPAIVATYPTALLRKVEKTGTVFGFTEEIRETIRAAVVHEITKRQAADPVPGGHGMGAGGGQQ
jgi:hypothetical protein